MDTKEKLRSQIIDATGNIQYTYSAHWNIVNRLKRRFIIIKIFQITLSAVSTCGVLTAIIANWSWLAWAGAVLSAIALGLNLYMLSFNLPNSIKDHVDAANELWSVREAYKSLLVDFDDLSTEQIRDKRDRLSEVVSQINKRSPGTDEKSFRKAQKEIGNYTFQDGEAEQLLHVENRKL